MGVSGAIIEAYRQRVLPIDDRGVLENLSGERDLKSRDLASSWDDRHISHGVDADIQLAAS